MFAVVFLITILAVAGAVGGVVTAGTTSLRRLTSFSSGVLIGMALFLILPEAFTVQQPIFVIVACLAGCATFGVLEATLHLVQSEPHHRPLRLIPLMAAIGTHSVLDGWNIAIALLLVDHRAAWTFVAGMALHKISGGFAIGAIFRANTTSVAVAIVTAGFCESLTLAGAALQALFRDSVGHEWTAWLLAVTSGSFLYLGYHALQNERRNRGLWSVVRGASLGVATIYILSLLHR